MKKIWLGVAGGVAIILLGVYIYITNIDWNEHKDTITRQFSNLTGKTVVFEGPVNLKLLPSPYLSARNIKVYNPDDREKPLATIQELVANLSFGSLLGGDFKVQQMALVEVETTFEFSEDGKLNWHSPITPEQQTNFEEIEITLDSVTLEKSKVHLIDTKHNIDCVLENMNAEVIAESVFGPYRIEGSYVKDGNPEGFAISLGQFSESFATSVNLVLNQPMVESYVRFDGTVLLKNDAINGNVIFESSRLADFLNHTFKTTVPQDYNEPLALSLELKTNSSKIDMGNIVVKYGRTAGAGNLIVPLKDVTYSGYEEDDDEEDDTKPATRKKVEVGFNMTDLDLEPMVKLIDGMIEHYSQENAEFKTNLDFDLLGDVKSIRTYYKGQIINDFDLSFDLLEDSLVIPNFSAVLPGETKVKLKGELFSDKGALTYNFDNELTSVDASKFMSWLGYELPIVADATYKRATSNFKMEGNLKTVKIAPIDLILDKTAVKGEIGVIRGPRKSLFMNLSADSINFDNYIQSLPKEESTKSFSERMNYKFKQLGFLNDYDVRGSLNLGLGIYESVPFENTTFTFGLRNGVMAIDNLDVSVSNSDVSLNGTLKGFGDAVSFENMKYSFETRDMGSLFNKFDLVAPNVNTRDVKLFNSKGTATGNFDSVTLKAISKVGTVDNAYVGEITKREGKTYFNGDIELRAPDFVKFVNDLNYNYTPDTYNLGLFALKAKVVGNSEKFQASNINANVGANNLQGTVLFDKTSGRSNVIANMVINRFEIDRFVYNYNPSVKTEKKVMFKPTSGEKGNFLARPFWDKTKLNYSFYNDFDFKGKFKVGLLSYKADQFKDANFDLSLQKSVAKLEGFNASYNEAPFTAALEMNVEATPTIKGNAVFEKQRLDYLGGKKYALDGILGGKVDFSSNASSEEDFYTNLIAKLDFDLHNFSIKGWDLKSIYDDLAKRDRSDGFAVLVGDSLQKGETNFGAVNGSFEINQGDFKLSLAELKSGTAVVRSGISGSIKNWEMQSDFNLRYTDLEKVPLLDFSFNGPMIDPTLVVKVDNITNVYDSHWAQVASDKKAAEKARIDNLNSLMKAQQDKALSLKAKIQNTIRPDFDIKKKATNSPRILQMYERIGSRVNDVDTKVEEVFTLGLAKDFDESLIEEISAKNDAIVAALSALEKELPEVYAQDVKLRINEDYSAIVGLYNKSKEVAVNYRDKYVEYPRKLSEINTDYRIEEDNTAKSMQDKIEGDLLSLDAINAQMSRDYIFIQNSTDMLQLEEYATTVDGLLVKAEENMADLKENIDNVFSHLNDIISREEAVYLERKKAEDVKKMVAENTGKISTSGGKNITVVRDIDEILDTKKDNIKVLDFSGGSVAKSKRQVKPVEEKIEVEVIETVVQEAPQDASGVIKKATGDVKKATGVIIKN